MRYRHASAAPGGGGAGAGGGAAGQSGTGPSLVTSVYETHLGLAALLWSRAALGLSLWVVLRVVGGAGASSSSAASDYGCYDDGPKCYEEEEKEKATVEVRVWPWLLWRRNDLAWDLRRARFACPGSPEPSSGYFVAVVVDGEMALVAGDMAEEAYRKTKAQCAPGPDAVLISRDEHVSMRHGGHGHGHKTFVNVHGRER